MRIVFIGRENNFNRRFIKELCLHHEILCCMFVELNRFSLNYRVSKIVGRIKKYGLLRVIDELAFHIFDRIFLRRKENNFWKQKPQFYFESTVLDLPCHYVDNVHSPGWINFIHSKSPDAILSICCGVIFKPQLFNIPRFGTYVLHEGIAPEYRGLHCTLWALTKNDIENVGYTLLKVNSIIDGGKILLQGKYKPTGKEGCNSWGWTSHIGIIEGIDVIAKAFTLMESDISCTHLESENRQSQYYSWMRLSSFLYFRTKFFFIANFGSKQSLQANSSTKNE